MREAKTDSRPTEIPRPTYARALPCAIIYRPVGAWIYFLRGDPKPKRIADQRSFHGQHTQGRCPLLCNTAPLGREIYFLRGDAETRRFHAPGASTLHGMTLGVTFWRCCRTLRGMTLGVRSWRRY